MLSFDFCEVLQSIDYERIEKQVKRANQVQLEQMLNANESILKNSCFEYERQEAIEYIKAIEEKMMNMSTSELVAI